MPQILSGSQRMRAMDFLSRAAHEAQQSTCLRRHCGSIIEYRNTLLASAYNRLPGKPGLLQPHCNPYSPGMRACKSDKTCCVHAEVLNIDAALRGGHAAKLPRSTIYFASVDEQGVMEEAEELYCTICSKHALEHEVGNWVLNMKGQGPTRFTALEYHQLTLQTWEGKENR